MLAVAQDVDRSAALMCYLQLSVLFIPAIVIVGNSITNPGIDPQMRYGIRLLTMYITGIMSVTI